MHIKWIHIANKFGVIKDLRSAFQQLLCQIHPILLITDCWYNDTLAAASLAAKSLGMRVCDVQHGNQEHLHPCFHRWVGKAPKGFLSPFPSILWVWGERTVSRYSGLGSHRLL